MDIETPCASLGSLIRGLGLGLSILGLLTPAATRAEEGPAAIRLTPADMRWQPWGNAQRIVLFGSAADFDCPYVDRIRLPKGYKVPSHAFSQDKVFTVLSGAVSVGIGEAWDEAKLKRLPAGSFWRIPSGVSYYFRSEVETVLQTQVGAVAGRDCGAQLKPP